MAYEPDQDWEASLIEAMRDDVAAYATPEFLDETLLDLLESLDPAEAINLGKVLSEIQKGAVAVVEDPTVRQIAQVAAPIAGAAIGGPVGAQIGAVVGSQLGTPPAAPSPSPAAPAAQPADKPGATALKALVATQMRAPLTGLLAAAMGPIGQQFINGVPVASVLATLSSLFAKAAAEADQWARQPPGAAAASAAEAFGPWDPPDDFVYASLVESESLDIQEALS
ncbi:hypothetical protein OG418_00360 [Streptomyces phaeochromogenes]|uniref:hypothetical protein n=1 Tax=Streptomyces phaeochromogenes TaxID=1923 RepID=UPI00324796B5